MKKKILFVCTGNTCRSPMAEAVLKHQSDDFEVQSAGLFAQKGADASEGTKNVLRKKGIPIQHQSQPVTPELVEWADYILTMTSQHKQMLITQYEEAETKTFTLLEFTNEQQREIWERLKTAYADLEEKKSQYLSKNKDRMTEEELRKKMHEHIHKDLENIRHLEAKLGTLDIEDPVGGNADVYMKTFQQIEKNIELLVKKLDNKDK